MGGEDPPGIGSAPAQLCREDGTDGTSSADGACVSQKVFPDKEEYGYANELGGNLASELLPVFWRSSAEIVPSDVLWTWEADATESYF